MDLNKIPTAKEFLINNANDISFEEKQMFASDVTPEMLIEFAKLHVEKAVKQILKNSKVQVYCGEGGLTIKTYTTDPNDPREYEIGVNENSILNAYPLENIK